MSNETSREILEQWTRLSRVEKLEVLATFEEDLRVSDVEVSKSTNGTSVPPAEPKTPLGRRLRTLRAEYVASGGELLNVAQLDREMDERRGERDIRE